VARPEGNRPLRPRRRWEENIKMDLRGECAGNSVIGHKWDRAGGMEWTDIVQDRGGWLALVTS